MPSVENSPRMDITCLAAEYMCLTSGSFLMIHSPMDRRIPPIQEDTKTPVMKMKIWGTRIVFGQNSMESAIVSAILAILAYKCTSKLGFACSSDNTADTAVNITMEVMNPKPNTCWHAIQLRAEKRFMKLHVRD